MRIQKSRFAILNQRGFTLVELMIVIGILGVLLTIAIRTLEEETRKASDAHAISVMRNLLTAMETQLPPTGNTYDVNGGMLHWADGPEIEIGEDLYVTIAEDTDGDPEGKWQVFGAHIGGKLGFYFWVPNENCTVEKDDKITDSGGNPTPADRIVPTFAEVSDYVYTAFRNEAIF